MHNIKKGRGLWGILPVDVEMPKSIVCAQLQRPDSGFATVVFSQDETVKNIQISVVDDSEYEGNETVVVGLGKDFLRTE